MEKWVGRVGWGGGGLNGSARFMTLFWGLPVCLWMYIYRCFVPLFFRSPDGRFGVKSFWSDVCHWGARFFFLAFRGWNGQKLKSKKKKNSLISRNVEIT
jgi:hypothetical protein